jgi:Ribbon-helix-helix protein, copG family
VPQLISNVNVRVSQEEANVLREMAALQQAPLSSVIRAMIRHYVLEWQAGRDISIELGAVVWKHTP